MNVTLSGHDEAPGHYPPGPLLYGKYRGSSSADVVGKLADGEEQALRGFLQFRDLIPANSAGQFTDLLNKNRSTLRLIVTFTHGQSGTTIDSNGQTSEDANGPKLLFAANEALVVDDLNALISAIPPDEDNVFAKAPIVFLNGCETGTGGFYPTTNQDFVGTFLRMGSQAVVATESPVWESFGYSFGLDLLQAIRAGTPLADALLAVRRQYLLQANNPLGLVYSIYGSPDAVLSFPP
jgi:hypothetical protein